MDHSEENKNQVSFSAVVKMMGSDYPTTYLEIPEKIIKILGLKYRERMVAEFENKGKIHCALHRFKDGAYYIYFGKYFRKKAQISVGEEVKVRLSVDTSELGVEVPEELIEVLAIDEAGNVAFQELTPGKKRSAAYYVARAKQIDTRIERALRIVDNLKLGFTDPREFVKKR